MGRGVDFDSCVSVGTRETTSASEYWYRWSSAAVWIDRIAAARLLLAMSGHCLGDRVPRWVDRKGDSARNSREFSQSPTAEDLATCPLNVSRNRNLVEGRADF